MERVLRCDTFFLGCGHVIRAGSDDELMRLAAEHVAEVHGLTEIDEATAQKVLAAITDE